MKIDGVEISSGIENWTVVIPAVVKEKIFYLAGKADPNEIQFFATVSVSLEKKEFLIDDIALVAQQIGPISGACDPQGLIEFLTEYPHLDKLHGFIHSHVRMGCYWAPVDLETIHGLACDDWLLSLVIDLSGDILARLDMSLVKVKEDAKHNPDLDFIAMLPDMMSWNNLKVVSQGVLTEMDKAELDKAFKENCYFPTDTSSKTGSDLVFQFDHLLPKGEDGD